MRIKAEDIEHIKKCGDSGDPYIKLHKNEPYFTNSDRKKGLKQPFEKYSKLDRLKRCGAAFACFTGNSLKKGKKPNHNNRIKLAAQKSIKCKDIEDGEYLYNRCHLIGRQFATKKVNRKGLITGTRWFNVKGMSELENEVADYIKDNPEHRILYRVTPYFKDNNLLAYGVQMEILDLDDEKGFSRNVFVYNKQPGFTIDYRNGDVYSEYPLVLSGKKADYDIYVIDKDTNKFHKKSCPSFCDIKKKKYFVGKKQTIEEEYCKCEICIS